MNDCFRSKEFIKSLLKSFSRTNDILKIIGARNLMDCENDLAFYSSGSIAQKLDIK